MINAQFYIKNVFNFFNAYPKTRKVHKIRPKISLLFSIHFLLYLTSQKDKEKIGYFKKNKKIRYFLYLKVINKNWRNSCDFIEMKIAWFYLSFSS